MILNFINLKQAHTNTIYNIREKTYIVRFEMCCNWNENALMHELMSGCSSRMITVVILEEAT